MSFLCYNICGLSVTLLNNSPFVVTMTHPTFPVSDLESFAEHLGLDGIDSDLFYECYYNVSDEDEDYECLWEGTTEAYEVV